ncbi:MAG: BrxA/BrxB family bacilliredoxin [Thermoanaerobaculia bacterium]|nr:BrxA/BrxB family bacilliredoxin [Thermoanaerobaculia bacterium]
MPYSPLLVKPMREELTSAGVEELRTAEDVERWMEARKGLSMLVINSVCGCAAGAARPGVRMALEDDEAPESVATVFAGQDVEATAEARSRFSDIPPSSPSIALFRDQELVYFVPRHRIETKDAEGVAVDLRQAFERFRAEPAAS